MPGRDAAWTDKPILTQHHPPFFPPSPSFHRVCVRSARIAYLPTERPNYGSTLWPSRASSSRHTGPWGEDEVGREGGKEGEREGGR